MCSSNRAIRLLQQPMKVLQSVKKDQMLIDNMQFGFMFGKRTNDSDTIFIMQVQELVLCFCGFVEDI